MPKKIYDVQYKPENDDSLASQGYKVGKKLRNNMVVWFKEINSAPAAGAGVLTLNSLADGIPLAQELMRTGRIKVGYDGDVDELINKMNDMGMGGGRARRRKSRKSRKSRKTRKSRRSRK